MLKTIRENYLDQSSFHLKCHQNNTHTPLFIQNLSLLTELNLFILLLFNFFSINTLINCIQNSNSILTFITESHVENN